MNTHTIISIEVEKSGNTFAFHMPIGVKYGEAYDAAVEVLEAILKLSKQVVDGAKRSDAMQDDCE